jgi:iron complex transport system substrate-binding protein
MVTRRLAGLATLALALVLLPLPAATAGRAAFPVTIKAANGTVTLPQKPIRIVSLSPTATEDLFAIGAGRQVIAVDDQSNYPPGAPKTKLSGYTPNAEAIAKYRPDLVIASTDTSGLFAALGKLHIPALLETPAQDLAGAYSQLEELGAATGHRDGARNAIASMRRRIEGIVASVPASSPPLTVYEELSPDYYSATSKTFTGQALELLGLKDIADAADKSSSGYPKLSAEYIVSADPDVIVLADTKCCGQTAAKVSQRPGWSTISAVRNGGVVGVSDDVASRWGPRIVDYLSSVAAKVKSVHAAAR